ncbi:MAG: ATP-dependent DNA ligase [archaeon]|nr:ATP-dependent DNA ligase [archaeon]
MRYKMLANIYDRLESTTLKLEKTAIISDFLEDISSDDLPVIVLLINGKIYPDWSSKEFGIASNLMLKAISKAYGISSTVVEKEWRHLGDLGLVAEKYSSSKKQGTLFSRQLTTKKLFDNLNRVAELEGLKSQEKKLDYICELLSLVSDPVEARYVARTVLGNLRVGAAEGLLRDAIARAFFVNIYLKETLGQKVDSNTRLNQICCSAVNLNIAVDEKLDAFLAKKYKKDYDLLKSRNAVIVKSADAIIKINFSKKVSGIDCIFCFDSVQGNIIKSKILYSVEHAFSMTNDFSAVAVAAKEKGIAGLEALGMTVNHPLKVMLYQKAIGIKEAFQIVGKRAAIEYKYDGFRLQVHKTGNIIKLFTRRLEDVTSQFPDVVCAVRDKVKADSFVLDCEVIGVDRKTGRWLPFQSISRRIKLKYDIEMVVKNIPVIITFFDAMMIDDKNLIDVPFMERRKHLESIIVEDKDRIMIAKQIVSDDMSIVADFYKESLLKGNEGIMMKNLLAPYKPGSRVGYGIKIKPIMDTLDLAVVGADYGEGKRAGLFSSFHLACYDADSSQFLSIGKLGTGIKEKSEIGVSFKELTQILTPDIIEEKGKTVILKPVLLVEVAFEEIQKSPKYLSGFALRFPRLVRLREDRMPEDASRLDEVEMLYAVQRGRNKN